VKDGVQLRHHQGGGNAFSGSVAQGKQQLSFAAPRCHDIAVISTHGPQRLVVVGDLPSLDPQILIGQELSLNLRRPRQILLKPGALRRGELVKAIASPPVGDRGPFLDHVAAEVSSTTPARAHRRDGKNAMCIAGSVKISPYHVFSLLFDCISAHLVVLSGEAAEPTAGRLWNNPTDAAAYSLLSFAGPSVW
jgi:hypothetical protein